MRIELPGRDAPRDKHAQPFVQRCYFSLWWSAAKSIPLSQLTSGRGRVGCVTPTARQDWAAYLVRLAGVSLGGGSKPPQRARQLLRNFSRSSGVILAQRSSMRSFIFRRPSE